MNGDVRSYSLVRKWYGPNLGFFLHFINIYGDDVEDIDDPFAQMSIPSLITLNLPEEEPSKYIFTRILEVSDTL